MSERAYSQTQAGRDTGDFRYSTDGCNLHPHCQSGAWGKGCGDCLTAGTIGERVEAGGVPMRCRWCQDADAHKHREGACVCGLPVAAHFTARNEKISCEALRATFERMAASMMRDWA